MTNFFKKYCFTCLIVLAFVAAFFIQRFYHQPTYSHLKLERIYLQPSSDTEKTLTLQISILKKQLNKQPKNIVYLEYLARSYAGLLQWKQALKAYDLLLSFAPNNSDYLIEKAYCLIQKNQSIMGSTILALALKALKYNSKNTYALLLLGSISLEVGKINEAVYFWKKHQKFSYKKHPSYFLVGENLKHIQK